MGQLSSAVARPHSQPKVPPVAGPRRGVDAVSPTQLASRVTPRPRSSVNTRGVASGSLVAQRRVAAEVAVAVFPIADDHPSRRRRPEAVDVEASITNAGVKRLDVCRHATAHHAGLSANRLVRPLVSNGTTLPGAGRRSNEARSAANGRVGVAAETATVVTVVKTVVSSRCETAAWR
jgi:hypothetical protein